jgi:hypothetical protein
MAAAAAALPVPALHERPQPAIDPILEWGLQLLAPFLIVGLATKFAVGPPRAEKDANRTTR